MAMILPKGIVVNTPEIEGNIERIATEPLDLADIAKFWKVYTTTQRRLRDPTAERLENYWWRIWGSRKRQLDGATVARLFAHISDGLSFVPLRGPANRDEGSPPLERSARFAPGAASAVTLRSPDPSGSGNGANLSLRSPVVMPPPILKKTRGPSTTGPRPTARFISPHESEDEAEPTSSGGSSSNVVVQPPSPGIKNTKVERRTSSAGKKKAGFVATGASKKKRPVVVRRQNSQSSADSVKRTDNTQIPSSQGSVQSSLARSPLGRSPPLIAALAEARGKPPASSKFQEQFSPEYIPAAAPTPRDRQESRKASKSSKGSTQKSPNLKSRERKQDSKSSRSSENRGSGERVQQPQTNAQRTSFSTASQRKIEEDELRILEGSTRQNTEQNRRSTDDRNSNASLQRSRSGTEYDALGIMHQDRKGSSSLASTLTPVTGTMGAAVTDTAPSTALELSPKKLTAKEKGKGRAEGEYQPEDLFAKRPVQPVGIPAASVPVGSLARSKSQLTLLLEKDQEDRAKNEGNKANGKKR